MESLSGRTLLVEDDPQVARLVGDILRRRGHTVCAVDNGDAAWQAYQEEFFSLVIVDWMLPGMSGVELVKNIRSRERSRYTEILMLTARDTAECQEEALEAGVDDYLSKPFSAKVLNLRIGVAETHLKGRVARCLAEDSQKLAIADMHRLVNEDPLTGVANRRYLMDRMETEVGRANRYQRPLCLLLLDMDDLSGINTRLGQEAGDQAIKRSIQRCRKQLRESDLIGRLGSDKFAVLMVESQPETAIAVAIRLQQLVEGLSFEDISADLNPTISTGVVALSEDGDSVETMLQRAEQALDGARAAGRNCVARFESDGTVHVCR